jgi:tetratricopeptide (TPR) repeat protein
MFQPRMPALILIAAAAMTFWGCASTAASGQRRARDENTAAYQYELAAVALKYGLEDEAVKYLEYALSLDGNHQPSLFLLASLKLKRKDHAGAEDLFLRSLAVKPDAETYTRLGMVYRETGAHDKAEEEFLRAWSLSPTPTAALNLAQHFFDRGGLDRALEFADRALAMDDRSVPGWNLRGVILNRLGRNAEAAASFEKVLALQPDNAVSAFNLAAIYISLGRNGEARTLLENLLPRVQDPTMKEKIAAALETVKK